MPSLSAIADSSAMLGRTRRSLCALHSHGSRPASVRPFECFDPNLYQRQGERIMTRVHQNQTAPNPVSIDDFQQLANDAASDGKLSAKEKRDLTKAFKSLDRDGQLQGIDF